MRDKMQEPQPLVFRLGCSVFWKLCPPRNDRPAFMTKGKIVNFVLVDKISKYNLFFVIRIVICVRMHPYFVTF